MEITLNQIGLILNLIGTLLMAFAIGEFKGGWTKHEKTNKDIYLALFKHPVLMKIGVILFVTGFVFSFASTIF